MKSAFSTGSHSPPPPNYPLLNLGTLSWLLLDTKSEQTLCAYYEEIKYTAYLLPSALPQASMTQLGISLS